MCHIHSELVLIHHERSQSNVNLSITLFEYVTTTNASILHWELQSPSYTRMFPADNLDMFIHQPQAAVNK